MPRKINHILIPLILISPLIFGSYILTMGQAPSSTTYLPLISYNMSGWIGPYGGTVVPVAIDPTNPQVVYAGTWGSGVFKSRDGGQNWQPLNSGLGNLYINALAVDPTQPSTIYAGTYRGQLYKSLDGGETWEWSGSGMQDQAIIYSIIVDPFTPSILYASTRGKSNNSNPPWSGVVYQSVDGGNSWSEVLTDVGGKDLQDWAYSLVVNPQRHNTIYAAFHESGPYQSPDYGANWYSIDRGISDYSGRVIAINPDASKNNTLYYGVWHNDAVYKSLDGGINWFTSSNGIPFAKVYSIVIDPFETDTVYMATYNQGILKTLDGGESWQHTGLEQERLYNVTLRPDTPSYLLAGTSGDGIYRSQDDGKTWQSSNAGLDNADLTSVMPSSAISHKLYASVYGAGVFQSTQPSLTWEAMNTGLDDKYVHSIVKNPVNPELIYALTDTGGLFRNDLKAGKGWESFGQGLPITPNAQPAYVEDHPFATYDMQEYRPTSSGIQALNQATTVNLMAMVFAPSAPLTAYLGTGGFGVYQSTDAGVSWHPAGLDGESILSLAVDPVNPDLIYAITASSGSLYISQNGGLAWDLAQLPVTFYSVASSPSSPGSVYAGTSNGIYQYISNSWTQLGLTGNAVTAIALSPIQAGLIYVGTTSGGYYTTDVGVTWKPVSLSMSNLTIQSISTDTTHANWAYFCTTTHGIYFADISN